MTDRPELAVHLAEYASLKDEQRARIIARDNLLYVMLTVVAAIGFFALSGSPRHVALLLLPPAGFVLGWVYLINDWKVSDLGRYFRTELAVTLAHCTSTSGLLAWEACHRQCSRRRYRKFVQMVTDLMVFCVPGLVAITVYWVNAPTGALFTAISCVEIISLCLLAVEIIRQVDISE